MIKGMLAALLRDAATLTSRLRRKLFATQLFLALLLLLESLLLTLLLLFDHALLFTPFLLEPFLVGRALLAVPLDPHFATGPALIGRSPGLDSGLAHRFGLQRNVVDDLADAFDVFRNLLGLAFLFPGHRPTAELHHTVITFHVYIIELVNRRIIERARDAARDHHVIHHLA